MATRFTSPFEVETPPGAEGWTDMYAYSSLFSEGRRIHEESVFWFQDGVHWPQPLPPWDATLVEYALASLSQYNSRHLMLPSSNGIDFRILNGYVYLSPVGVPDEDVDARIPEFVDRAGHYFANWDDLYANWMVKIRRLVADLEALSMTPLPDMEDVDAVVKSGLGVGSGFALLSSYRRLLDLALQLWQYHFEFLNLGYAAYLDFFGFCKQAWPSIPDLAIAKMVAGVEVDLFRPDEELKRLARLAADTGLSSALDAGAPEDVFAAMSGSDAGRAWVAAYEDCSEPWFNFSTGSGFYHSDRIWIESPEVPLEFIRGYVAMIERGEVLDRPLEAIRAERERLVEEYGEFLPDDSARGVFHAKLGLARKVFPYVENHNFYVEHWSHSIIWRKMRALGQLLADEGFWPEANDIFFLKRTEVEDALWDYYVGWATPTCAAGPAHWPDVVARRREVLAALRAWKPAPALGRPPEVITEPFTIMLWGITRESIASRLGEGEGIEGQLRGFAASPGLAEGPARVVFSADHIGEVLEGEILVAPLTAPSWAPLFGKIAATVTDTGGIMSHAAIVCREYGLPAVTGTGVATSTIVTGMRLRVDGTGGTVTIID
jgi:pyruvate,water dikinase